MAQCNICYLICCIKKSKMIYLFMMRINALSFGIVFLLLGNKAVYGMDGIEFPPIAEGGLALVKVIGQDSTITPHSIRVYKKDWNDTKQRTVYHYDTVRGIVVHDKKIAPEHFCKTVAQLAQAHKISVPIIPCIKKGIGEFDAFSNSVQNIIYFSKEYVNNEKL